MTIDSRRLLMNGLGAVIAATTLSGAAFAADGPRYTYGQISYVELDFDDIDGIEADGDGFNLAASAAVADMVHIFAGYTDGDIDIDGFGFSASADYTEWSAGVGLNYAVSDTVDLVGRLAYLNAEIELLGFSEDEDGYGLAGGVRAMITPQFELNGAVAYSDYGDDLGDDTALEAGAVYNFTDVFAIAGGVSFSDDATQYGIGLRLYFGDR